MVRCVRDVCQGSARYSTAATVFVVNAATFGRVNAYARWSLVQLKLSSWLLACAFFGLLMSYSTLASVFVHPLFAERIGAKEIEN